MLKDDVTYEVSHGLKWK